MNRFLFAALLMTGSAFGATITICDGAGSSGSFTLDTAANTNTYSCGDKSFTGFSVTAGSGIVSISQTTLNNYGLTYSPVNDQTTTPFTFTFDVAVTSTDRIVQVSDQFFSNTALPNGSTVTVTHTPSGMVVVGAGAAAPGSVVGLSAAAGGALTGYIDYSPGIASANVSAVYAPNGANSLRSLEFGITEATPSTVPEPMTLSLVGSGLIALGVISRRKTRA